MQTTFAIIKPDATLAKHTGKIIDLIEKEGFEVVGLKKVHMTQAKAEEFYAVHNARPFFGELVSFMTSGPCVLLALRKENAIAAWRDLMGATDPAKAAPNTMRALFGTNVGSNATHGSDAPETAQTELKLFFPELV
ncbi:nucleoside-diphosphate kinase [Candidatus Dependentiae bacterium]|nr:nucleoside-diphosphate kinase [Candidatus Dependentiae bacterium]